ncbi:MAG TPA: S8 family serine peptidase, partial [Acidimicrobiia bacterium]|nr:S8 family serine peptidase [Acidimicrobiia bacterium]
ADAIKDAVAQGAVVVAAAGNNSSCRPFWPAAMKDVIAVGANYCGERAWFSNFGPWVDANAPGVDIVSTFFMDFDGPLCAIDGPDPDKYEGWAEWSGTSFAAPRVAAEIARVMCEGGLSAPVARDQILSAQRAIDKGYGDDNGEIEHLGVVVAVDDWMD